MTAKNHILYSESTGPKYLDNFRTETKNQIMIKNKQIHDEQGNPLLILEWDDTNLRTRNMSKAQVLSITFILF
jgi:hypothetical protein